MGREAQEEVDICIHIADSLLCTAETDKHNIVKQLYPRKKQTKKMGQNIKERFNSVQLHPTLYDTMDCSTPGLPVHHQLPELAQTHVHLVSDAIQPSHPLSPPSPPAFSLSQHQGLGKECSP